MIDGPVVFDDPRLDAVQHLKSALAASNSPYMQAMRGSRLAAFVESQIIKPPADILNAFEELAIMRETAARVVALYAAARDGELRDPENQKKQLLADQAAFIMKESLKEVVDMCERAARISSTVNRAFSWGYINQIVLVMLRAIGEVVHDQDMLEQIANKLRTDFQLLQVAEPETNHLLHGMDETIPIQEENKTC